MPTLEEYLNSSYLTHRQDISALDKAIEEAARTLCNTQNGAGAWTYEHTFGKKATPAVQNTGMSAGTTAMVLAAIGRVLGKEKFGDKGISVHFSSEKTKQNLREAFDLGQTALQTHLSDNMQLASNTFGNDNPITLSHVVDFYTSLKDPLQPPNTGTAIGKLREIGNPNVLDNLLTAENKDYQTNSFVPLRAIRTIQHLEGAGFQDPPYEVGHLRSFFETRLHEQLSFSTIPDSRFDPAELVFSLEGLLICAQHAVDPAVMNRVLDVLADKQNTSSHWRPSKPFLTSKSGEITLPISVEVANSLMRAVATMDQGRSHDTYTSKALPLLRRFWGWIQARTVRGTEEGQACSGWHSEHINVPDLIHTWDTSQVVEFMVAYRELLEREIATTTLRLSGLTSKVPQKGEGGATEQWDKIKEDFDTSPTIKDGIVVVNDDTVYGKIGKHFVEGWARGEPKNYSMLLYGPPGTGKTSVAHGLSQALDMPLITVTVSDFLGDGGVSVEARAKAIFQTLMHQRDVVILFDEIDSFLLDRDSKFYGDQDTLFQFLTPGMLPKIQELRNAEASIFIIATNYENRIDPAIKRAGRIDYKYLVSLPNSVKRTAILKKFGVTEAYINDDVLKASVYLGHGDLKTVAKDFTPQSADSDTTRKSLAEVLASTPSASSLSSYLNRIKSNPEDCAPAEIDDMIRLAHEAAATDKIKETAKVIKQLSEKDQPVDVLKLLSKETQEILSQHGEPSQSPVSLGQ